MADRDQGRFVGPIEGITRDERGNILAPPPGEERDLALRAEKAWDYFHANGDETGLIELGIFSKPPPDQEQRRFTD